MDIVSGMMRLLNSNINLAIEICLKNQKELQGVYQEYQANDEQTYANFI